mgnify:CR=1 FL=1
MTRDEKITALNSRCDKCQSCDECRIDTIDDEETFNFIDNNNCDFNEMNDEMLDKCYNWYKELDLVPCENAEAKCCEVEPDDLKLHIDPKVARHYAICQKLNAVYKAKNHDYGDSFGDTYKKLGIISAVTRLSDKMNRLMSLAVKHDAQVKDEKIEDTLLDMANYAIMTLIELGYEPEN